MAMMWSVSNIKPLIPSVTTCQQCNVRSNKIMCKAAAKSDDNHVTLLSRRDISFATLLFGTLNGFKLANAAILEADDDEELLEKVKKDRKKRLEKQGVIVSSAKETAYLQDLVYKLSKVGQSIENNDLSTASSVLGSSKDSEWVKNVNSAFNKLSSSEEEKEEIDSFNSSLFSLISSVSKNDIEGSKASFVASATAFEKWTALSGLVEQLKGL